MRQNFESEKSQARLAESSMNTIEAKAAAQYKKDQAEAERHRKETLGSWEPDAGSGFLYNAVHRHYFEPKTGESSHRRRCLCLCCTCAGYMHKTGATSSSSDVQMAVGRETHSVTTSYASQNHLSSCRSSAGMYYGGDPPAWTTNPAILTEALYSAGSDRDQGAPCFRTLPAHRMPATSHAVLPLHTCHILCGTRSEGSQLVWL